MKDILFRDSYATFQLTQTVVNMLKGKDGVPLEFEALLPDMMNPFKKTEAVQLYDKRSARAFKEAITLGLIPESILSLLDIPLLTRSAS